MCQNTFAAGAPPRTPVTTLPRPLAGFGEGEEEGKGVNLYEFLDEPLIPRSRVPGGLSDEDFAIYLASF